MERRLVKRVDEHFVNMKTNVKDWMTANNIHMSGEEPGKDYTSDFLKYIFDYQGISITKDDFQKRKRTKNIVPHYERCTALRANGEQCTRRMKDGEKFCGTHIKGRPHGVVATTDETTKTTTKIEVWVEEIQGINYYIDKEYNVYKHDDIMTNKTNPSIIAKWEHNSEGEYWIPEYDV
tara:strand:- start:415 stop:948 length:534 start_codon:yes stop_codon:yes gene_type:complete